MMIKCIVILGLTTLGLMAGVAVPTWGAWACSPP